MESVKNEDIIEHAEEYGYQRLEAYAESFEDAIAAFEAIYKNNREGSKPIHIIMPNLGGYIDDGAVFDFWTNATIPELRSLWETNLHLHYICETIQRFDIHESCGFQCAVCKRYVQEGIGNTAWPCDKGIGRSCDTCFENVVMLFRTAKHKKFALPVAELRALDMVGQQQQQHALGEKPSPSKLSVLAMLR